MPESAWTSPLLNRRRLLQTGTASVLGMLLPEILAL